VSYKNIAVSKEATEPKVRCG